MATERVEYEIHLSTEDLTASLEEVIGKINNELVGAFTRAEESINRSLDRINSSINSIDTGGVAVQFGNMQTSATNTLDVVSSSFSLISDAIDLAAEKPSALSSAFGLVGDGVSVLSGLLQGMGVTGVLSLGNIVVGAIDLMNTLDDLAEKIENTPSEVYVDTLNDMADGISTFMDKVKNAQSAMGDFNNAILGYGQTEYEVSANVTKYQNDILAIYKQATDEKRGLRQEEQESLAEYEAQLALAYEEEMQTQLNAQETVLNRAQVMRENGRMSLDEAAKLMQEAFTTNEESRAKAEEQMYEELEMVRQRYEALGQLGSDAQKAEEEAILAHYDEKIAATDRLTADTLAIIQQGYYEVELADDENYQNLVTLLKEKSAAEEEYTQGKYSRQENISKMAREHGKNQTALYLDLNDEYKSYCDSREAYLEDLDNRIDECYKNIDGNTLGTYMAISGYSEYYGNEIDRSNSLLVDNMMDDWEFLPPETRKAMENAMMPMLDEMETKRPDLYAKMTSIANGILYRLKSVFQEHSPSKATREIFKNLIKGGENGLDEESPKLLENTADLAEKTMDAFSAESIRTVDSMNHWMGRLSALKASVVPMATVDAQAVAAAVTGSLKGVNLVPGEGMLHATLNIDGREFAIATTPYVSEELAWRR